MAPTLLIVGATGNTGVGVVETLSKSRDAGNNTFSAHRILALTRSLNSPTAQRLAKLPGVEVVEKHWVDITADWLREQEVVRAFIAPHAQPNQFAEESTFHVAALRAGVKYVVRISTTAANVYPDHDSYYPRSHWAIETMLGSPEFRALHWTSLQANIFTNFYLFSALEFIKTYRTTGELGTFKTVASVDAPIGIVDPYEVGILAARLLTQDDTTPHNKAKYVVNGPVDITGKELVELVEQQIGTKVENVVYKDLSFVDYMVATTKESKNVISSVKHSPETAWEGKCTASTTSKEVLELAAPKHTPANVLKALLEG